MIQKQTKSQECNENNNRWQEEIKQKKNDVSAAAGV